MSGIPEATAITLTEAERAELEGLARSTKTEYRLRQRARIVLLAADGYKRHGTTTLFAALDIASGEVRANITAAAGASSSSTS